MEKGIKETAPHTKEIKRKRKRLLTREEKEYRVQRIEDKIEVGKRILNPPLLSETEGIKEWSKEEIKQQERDLCDHLEIFEKGDYLVCKYCGITTGRIKPKGTKEKIRNLFCAHKELDYFDDIYDICVKCGEKFRKNKKK